MNQRFSTPGALSLAEIATRLGANLVGDGSLLVQRVCEPLAAQSAYDLALAMRTENLAQLAHSRARAAVLAEGMAAPESLQAYLTVKQPRYALARLLALFSPPPRHTPGIHPSAVIEPSAHVAASASIGALVYISADALVGERVRIMSQATIGAGVVIGADSEIHAGARIADYCVIGARVIVRSNACIGDDGFSFATPETSSVEAVKASKTVTASNRDIVRIPALGRVVLEDDVEVGACTTIARATLGQTVVKRGAKIDSQVLIAHNCVIGEDCLVAGQVGIAGSCEVGERVAMGGQVGIADHVKIGADAHLAAGAGIAYDVPARAFMIDIPAVPYPVFTERYRALGRVKRLLRDFLKLEERVDKLEREHGKA